MDEVFVRISGELHYLWRAVDQDGDELDILVQKHRDKRAAKRFFRKLLKGLQFAPSKIVIDKLRSYDAARKELLPSVIHDQGKRMNNRAEVSHQPTRQRERQMRKFKSMRHAQRFLSVHGPITNLFRLCRQGIKAKHYRTFRDIAFATWREVTCVQKAALQGRQHICVRPLRLDRNNLIELVRFLSCVADTDTKVMVWKAQEAAEFCAGHPKVGYRAVAGVAKLLDQWLQHLNQITLDRVSWGLEPLKP